MRVILLAVPMGLMSLTMSVYLIFIAVEFKAHMAPTTTSIPAE